MFSLAQYETVISEIETGTKLFEAKLAEVIPAARTATSQWWITPPAAEAINWIAEQTVAVGTAMLEWILDLLKGAVAPIVMFMDAYRWIEVRGEANGVATDLTNANLVVDDADWSGKAREAYLAAAGAQSAAAARIGSIADRISENLLACAGAGLLFYIVVAGVLVKLIAATVTAIVALGSAVFSWTGALIVLEEAGVNKAVLASAAGTLGAFLVAQIPVAIHLYGEATDGDAFPDRVWPRSNTGQYRDATVKDGDADWSLKHE